MKNNFLQNEENLEILLSIFFDSWNTTRSMHFILLLFTHNRVKYNVELMIFLISEINFLRRFIQNMSLNTY